eukprot:TRINITY_DN4883_c0_g1_i1.p1 TRINITY_DN4883_c0_g1~~TRINITY_DN4883_c0_g1_i1.p1  ORF type:complete len:199 (-),score=36.02 TRINITY_DN4883_c0_g1_i1:263-859(-)
MKKIYKQKNKIHFNYFNKYPPNTAIKFFKLYSNISNDDNNFVKTIFSDNNSVTASKGRHRFQRLEDRKVFIHPGFSDTSRPEESVSKYKQDDYGHLEIPLAVNREDLRWKQGRQLGLSTNSTRYNWSFADVENLLKDYNYTDIQRVTTQRGLPSPNFNITFVSKNDADKFFRENHKKTLMWTRINMKSPFGYVHPFFF